MLKKIFIVFTCFFLLLNISPTKASASYYQDKSPFDSVRFSFSYSQFYDFDYYILVASPQSYDNTTQYGVTLFFISDNSQETYSSAEGVLKVYTDSYPYSTFFYSDYNGGVGSSWNYSGSYFSSSLFSSDTSSVVGFFNRGSSFYSSFSYNGLVFDNYNLDKFPTYEGASSNYTSKIILASNVDIYNQYGELLQYGNYYTFLQYFGGTLDASKIKDWSGHETAPGVVVEPTTGGTGGDSQTSKDQLETSKGIWGTVKDIFNSISSLPEKIANAISGFFDNLLNGIIEGLKFLFVPSDNLFDDLVELIKNKFGFVFQIIEIGDFLLNFDFSDTPPDLSFDFSNYNGSSRFIQFLNGFKFELLDWSVIDPYRGFIRGLISAITWYFFLKSLPKTLVNLINGQIGDENI